MTLILYLAHAPVCEPRWAWWASPVPPCSRCRDTGCVQRPAQAVLAACGWRWCGGVSWRGRGTPCPVCPGWRPRGSHPVTPSSQSPWYLFSGGKRRRCLRLQLKFQGHTGTGQQEKGYQPLLLPTSVWTHTKTVGDYVDFTVPSATAEPESHGALWEEDTRTGGI